MLDNLSALVSVTLGGSVCILLFLAAGPLLSKHFTPRWRYCAWGVLAAVLILFQPFHATLPKSEDWSGLVQLSIPQAVSENAYDRENARNRDWEEIQKTGNGGRGAETENQDGERLRHSVQYGEMVVIEDNDYVRKVTVGDETTYTVHWTGVAYGAYQAVVFLSVGFVLGRYFWTRRNLLRVSSPAGEEDQMALEAARRRTGCDREAELYRCSGIHTPMLMGFHHPVILLPGKMPEGSLEAALSHELTHLKRKDTGYMLILTAVRCVHWFNPLVWLMVRTARRDMELCCDYDLLNGQGEEAPGLLRPHHRVFRQQERGVRPLPGHDGHRSQAKGAGTAGPGCGGYCAVRVPGGLSGRGTAPDLDGLGGCGGSGGTRRDLYTAGRQYGRRYGTAPLAEDAQLLHTYEGEAYPLNPETLRYTQDMAQDGLVGTVELNGRGEVVRVQLNTSSQLDLTAAGLDFAGYCGEVYAAGMGGAMLLHGVAGISVDPCNELGQDSDHTRYTLPLAEDAQISATDMPFLTGLSSALYPDLFQLTVVNGEVTAIEGVWPEAENTVTLPIDPEEETPSNPENMPEHDPDFYGENGAEDMPEYDPGFYGESGAQPLEPDGSGTA